MTDEIIKSKELHKKTSMFTYIGYTIGTLILFYILFSIVKCCVKRSNKRHTHRHDDNNCCSKFVNYLTLNVQNRSTHQRNSIPDHSLELSEPRIRKRSTTPKPIVKPNLESESQDEGIMYTQSMPQSSRREGSIRKGKY